MENDNVTPVAEELTSPHFDTLTTSRAHPVVPLGAAPEVTRGRGILSGIRHARPAALIVAAILLAAVLVAAAEIYRGQQSMLATGSVQGLDSTTAASQPVEDAAAKRVDTSARRRPTIRSSAPSMPVATVPQPVVRDEVLGTIRQVLQERSRSRGEREEKDDHRGKHGDKHGGKGKHGHGKDGDDN